MHGHVDPAEWADIMPQIKHVHAKFYDIDEHGDEPAIDYPAIVREFVRGGYSGFFSSEWEGHRSEEHTSELQSRQYLVCRLLLEKKKITIPARTGLNDRDRDCIHENTNVGIPLIDIAAFDTPASFTFGNVAHSFDDVERDTYRIL